MWHQRRTNRLVEDNPIKWNIHWHPYFKDHDMGAFVYFIIIVIEYIYVAINIEPLPCIRKYFSQTAIIIVIIVIHKSKFSHLYFVLFNHLSALSNASSPTYRVSRPSASARAVTKSNYFTHCQMLIHLTAGNNNHDRRLQWMYIYMYGCMYGQNGIS